MLLNEKLNEILKLNEIILLGRKSETLPLPTVHLTVLLFSTSHLLITPCLQYYDVLNSLS